MGKERSQRRKHGSRQGKSSSRDRANSKRAAIHDLKKKINTNFEGIHPLQKAKATNFELKELHYYCSLPHLHLGTKLYKYPFSNNRVLNKGVVSKIESEFRSQLHTEPDMGIMVNLIDPEVYSSGDVHQKDVYHRDDLIFIKDESETKAAVEEKSWLKKPEYATDDISLEENKPRIQRNISMPEEEEYRSQASFHAEIDKQFRFDVRTAANKRKEIDQVYDVLPNAAMFESYFIRMLFDSNPLLGEQKQIIREYDEYTEDAFYHGAILHNLKTSDMVSLRDQFDANEFMYTCPVTPGEGDAHNFVRYYRQAQSDKDFDQSSLFFMFNDKTNTIEYVPVQMDILLQRKNLQAEISRSHSMNQPVLEALGKLENRTYHFGTRDFTANEEELNQERLAEISMEG